MGIYVNPDNGGFQIALNSIYVDKTGLLEYTNRVMHTRDAWICNSRARKFGKSTTVNMLVAYYSKGCDSSKMFDGLAISKSKDYREHLNRYDVICFDVHEFVRPVIESKRPIHICIGEAITEELAEEFPEVDLRTCNCFVDVLAKIHLATGRDFIIVVDEWDAIFVNDKFSKEQVKKYIRFLRDVFDGMSAREYIRLAFLTGVLPVSEASNRVLDNFRDFTMLHPSILAPYIGFTEWETAVLCKKHNISMNKMTSWYGGYRLGGFHAYNPNSVTGAVYHGDFIVNRFGTRFIKLIDPALESNENGIRDVLRLLMDGYSTPFCVLDYSMLHSVDYSSVFAVMVYLGLLAYDENSGLVFIPNEEVKQVLSWFMKYWERV